MSGNDERYMSVPAGPRIVTKAGEAANQLPVWRLR